MDNIILVVYGISEEHRINLERIFIDQFGEPIAKISEKAKVLFFQRNQKPTNKYNAKIYCDDDDKVHGEILKLLIQSPFDIDVEPFL
jgi:hypothetical protein